MPGKGFEPGRACPTRLEAPCDHRSARHSPVPGHVSEFAKILTGRHGERFDAWITAVDASGLPDLCSPSHRIKRHYDAVLAGLTLPHSSGAVEGNVNGIMTWRERGSARPFRRSGRW